MALAGSRLRHCWRASISRSTISTPPRINVSLWHSRGSWRAAVHATGDQRFGFQAGQSLHPCLLGLGGLAATHAPSLSQCLTTLARYSPLNASWFEMSGEKSGASSAWCLSLATSIEREATEQILDAWAAGLVAFGRLIVGPEFHAQQILLRRPPPVDCADYNEFFQCETVFDAGENRVVIANKWLEQTYRLNDPFLFEQLVFAASALRKSEDCSIMDAVEQAIRRGLFGLPEVAQELGLNERTIQRRI